MATLSLYFECIHIYVSQIDIKRPLLCILIFIGKVQYIKFFLCDAVLLILRIYWNSVGYRDTADTQKYTSNTLLHTSTLFCSFSNIFCQCHRNYGNFSVRCVILQKEVLFHSFHSATMSFIAAEKNKI